MNKVFLKAAREKSLKQRHPWVYSGAIARVEGKVENVSIDHLYGRVAVAGLIPYPPGIPIIMSGENFGNANSPVIAYLKSLQQWNQAFPGFDHITEGLTVTNGKGYVMCLKK